MIGVWLGGVMFFFGVAILGFGYLGYYSDVSSARPVMRENKIALRVGGAMLAIGFVVSCVAAALIS